MGQSFSAEPVVEKHTETDRNETYDAAVSTCQGWRFSQEDDHSLKLELPGEHKASFFAVFDGHGSARVSKHAAESLWRHITENELYIKGNFKEALEQSFLSFDREVFDSYNAQLAGTTATSVLIVDNVIYCANIGDSRSVASINCQCVPLSHDHKPENPLELKRILAAGGYVLGNRVNGNLALSRAFGDFHYKSNEQLPADQQIVSPFPEIKRIELTDDVDFIVLACDGIWDVLTSEEVVEFVISRLEHEVRPDQICEQLTTRCLATDYELVIGCDNMTVLLVCYTHGRSWSDYCTDIFNKNSKKLGMPNRKRELDSTFGTGTTTFQHPNQRNDENPQQPESLGTSSSSDQSSESTLNSTFASYDSSSASENENYVTRLAAAHRGMDELFYLLQTGQLPDDMHRETPTITEVPTEEVVTIHEDEPTSDTSADQSAATSASAKTPDQPESNTTEIEEIKKSPTVEKPDEELQQSDESIDENRISSGTAEIKLDDNDIREDDLPDASQIEPIELNSLNKNDPETGGENPSEAQGTVEIELSAPDDAPENGESACEETTGQTNEIDEGITIEAAEESGPQGDTSNTVSEES